MMGSYEAIDFFINNNIMGTTTTTLEEFEIEVKTEPNPNCDDWISGLQLRS